MFFLCLFRENNRNSSFFSLFVLFKLNKKKNVTNNKICEISLCCCFILVPKNLLLSSFTFVINRKKIKMYIKKGQGGRITQKSLHRSFIIFALCWNKIFLWHCIWSVNMHQKFLRRNNNFNNEKYKLLMDISSL